MDRGAICVVGGATGALGGAVVARLAADGWSVVALHRGAEPPAFPDSVVPHRCDLSSPQDVARLAADVVAMGRWEAAVSCSGGFTMGPAHDVDERGMLDQLELNLLGPWRLVQAASRAMIGTGSGGRIVVTVSRAAVEPAAGQAAYQISKVACARLVEVAARELRDQGITVNGVLPSIMDTPANRAAMPRADHARWVPVADVAAAIAWLLSGDAAAVTGALLPVYGRT